MTVLPPLIDAALAAGEEIARIYAAGCAIETKKDGSPVTIADRRAEEIILERLHAAFPGVPIVAEEEACAGRVPQLGQHFFLVDPLDGTRGFAERTGEFTVNVALVEGDMPVAGVIFAPVGNLLYGGERGGGAFRRNDADERPIRVRAPEPGRIVAVGSRNSRPADEAKRLAVLGASGYLPSSSSLKFCTVAEGSADIYPRWGPTMEWDTAAGHAILAAAGGSVRALDESGGDAGELRYGKVEQGFLNPYFLASGSRREA
jgi:3'(2'), 5'-bisphosphate nucleotidase